MGRPLNKRFFAGGTGVTVGCSFHDGTSVVESAIISQKSGTQFRVAGGGGTPVSDYTDLAFADDNPDTITRTGGTSFVTSGFVAGATVRVASAEDSANDGVYLIATASATVLTLEANVVLVVNTDDEAATLALVDSQGVLARLVQGAPTVLGEMQVTAQPENAQTVLTAEIAFTSSGGTGALLTVSIDNPAAHYGYHANGTNVGIDGGVDGTVDFTVANGKIVSIVINSAGSSNAQSESPNSLSQAAAANPPVQSISNLQAHTVRTFEGNRYDWPITSPLGDTQAAGSLTQCDLQSTDL